MCCGGNVETVSCFLGNPALFPDDQRLYNCAVFHARAVNKIPDFIPQPLHHEPQSGPGFLAKHSNPSFIFHITCGIYAFSRKVACIVKFPRITKISWYSEFCNKSYSVAVVNFYPHTKIFGVGVYRRASHGNQNLSCNLAPEIFNRGRNKSPHPPFIKGG